MNLADELDRAAGECADHDLAGLLVAAAWRLRRLTTALATATGRPEAVIRLSEGLENGEPAWDPCHGVPTRPDPQSGAPTRQWCNQAHVVPTLTRDHEQRCPARPQEDQ